MSGQHVVRAHDRRSILVIGKIVGPARLSPRKTGNVGSVRSGLTLQVRPNAPGILGRLSQVGAVLWFVAPAVPFDRYRPCPLDKRLTTFAPGGHYRRMKNVSCPFCEIDPARVIGSNDFAIAAWDGFPVTEGHALVVPRKHVTSLFEAAPEEIDAVWRLVGEVRDQLRDTFGPDGFNIGLNDGVSAGQTVMHAHVHVIPRRKGDVRDPRGGVRLVIGDKARYWREET